MDNTLDMHCISVAKNRWSFICMSTWKYLSGTVVSFDNPQPIINGNIVRLVQDSCNSHFGIYI